MFSHLLCHYVLNVCVLRPVEVSVSVATGLCGAGVSRGVDRSVRLPLPQYHSHTVRRAATSAGW